jgi:hypothetical protein
MESLYIREKPNKFQLLSRRNEQEFELGALLPSFSTEFFCISDLLFKNIKIKKYKIVICLCNWHLVSHVADGT